MDPGLGTAIPTDLDLTVTVPRQDVPGAASAIAGASSMLRWLPLWLLLGALGMGAVAIWASGDKARTLRWLGIASVAIAQAAVAGLSTYGLGQVTKTYLTNGATWGPEGPRAVVHQILDSLDEASILNRIKAELRARL